MESCSGGRTLQRLEISSLLRTLCDVAGYHAGWAGCSGIWNSSCRDCAHGGEGRMLWLLKEGLPTQGWWRELARRLCRDVPGMVQGARIFKMDLSKGTGRKNQGGFPPFLLCAVWLFLKAASRARVGLMCNSHQSTLEKPHHFIVLTTCQSSYEW